jgi:asparagine synthetase B (glutamine-hydrolysing)
MDNMRTMLESNIEAGLEGYKGDVAISFSGGTDSTCMLLSLLALGFKPYLYTYAVDKASLDLARARMCAEKFDLPLTVCMINPSRLEKDVRKVIKDGIKGRVCIQCMHGHNYVAPHVKQPFIFNGSGIDAIYGVYKSITILARHDKTIFDQLRKVHLDNPNDDAMVYQSELYLKYGAKVLYPYRQPNIISFLMSKSWEEINRPRLKWITTKYYPEFNQLPKGYWRPRGSQQIIAGTRALHERLLTGPLNHAHHRRVEIGRAHV